MGGGKKGFKTHYTIVVDSPVIAGNILSRAEKCNKNRAFCSVDSVRIVDGHVSLDGVIVGADKREQIIDIRPPKKNSVRCWRIKFSCETEYASRLFARYFVSQLKQDKVCLYLIEVVYGDPIRFGYATAGELADYNIDLEELKNMIIDHNHKDYLYRVIKAHKLHENGVPPKWIAKWLDISDVTARKYIKNVISPKTLELLDESGLNLIDCTVIYTVSRYKGMSDKQIMNQFLWSAYKLRVVKRHSLINGWIDFGKDGVILSDNPFDISKEGTDMTEAERRKMMAMRKRRTMRENIINCKSLKKDGLTNAEIAKALGLCESTVRNYVSSKLF